MGLHGGKWHVKMLLVEITTEGTDNSEQHTVPGGRLKLPMQVGAKHSFSLFSSVIEGSCRALTRAVGI